MPISMIDLLMRLGCSVVLGGLIGFERERREQPAGLRTHLLVSLASATFMVVSTQFPFHQAYVADGVVRADIGRIASNVVVGIGFLGGGAILRSGLQIKGLTTAASLWLVAAVGLASGAGMLILATLVTSISLFALVALRQLERSLRHMLHLRISLVFEGDSISRTRIEESLGSVSVEIKDLTYSIDRVQHHTKVTFGAILPRHQVHEPVLRILENLPGIQFVSVRQSGG